MTKAIAISKAASPFSLAVESARNTGLFLADLMYGSPERLRLTYAFCFGLVLLGYSLDASQLANAPVCTQ